MSTRAQIGFYDDAVLRERPVAIVYQHSDGYPTGNGGVVGKLVNTCVGIIEQRGGFDPAYLAAQTLFRLIGDYDGGASGLGFGIDNVLHSDTRFFYAVTSEGVHVFDARDLEDAHLNDLSEKEEMFFTAWVDDKERLTIEAKIKDLNARLQNLFLRRASVARRKP